MSSEQAEFWDERFRGEGFAFGTAPNGFLASQSQYLGRGLRALVPGDGEGRNGVWLAEQGLDVLAIDFSPAALEKSRALAAERGVKLRTEIADVTTWRWPVAAFDVVVSMAGPSGPYDIRFVASTTIFPLTASAISVGCRRLKSSSAPGLM